MSRIFVLFVSVWFAAVETSAQHVVVSTTSSFDSPELNAYMRTMFKQVYQVRGKVYGKDDFEPKPYPLQGANVKVTCVGDTTHMEGQSVWRDGRFDVWIGLRERLKDTRVKVEITYVGMDTYSQILTPTKGKENGVDTYTVKLDSIVLSSKPMTSEEVEIVAELKKMYQRGDTVIFNVDAYEMPSGSVLLDLVRRLPGLKYEQNKMTYQGRDINEIKLNGESFFQRDMSIALNNMPTEKLKGLKVYEVPDDTTNVMSDNHLVMDMQTKEPMLGTIFSEFTAGTTEKFDHHTFSGNFSSWRQKGAQINSNFSTSDIPSEGSYSLKSVRTDGSLSYTQDFGKTNMTAYGNHNYNRNENKSDSYTKLFMPDYTQNSMNENTSSNQSKNWSGGTNIGGNAGKWSYWNISTDFSKSNSENFSQSLDSLSNEGEGLITTTRQVNSSTSESKNISTRAMYILVFDEEHRNTMNFNYSYNHNDDESTSFNQSYSRFLQHGDSVRDVNHRILSPSRGNAHDFAMSYDRRLGDYDSTNSYLRVQYTFHVDKNTSTQNYEDIHPDGTYTSVDSLHYDKSNSEVNHNFNLSYNYNTKKVRFNIGANLIPTHRTIENDQYGKNEYLKSNGLRYSFNTSYNYKFGKNQFTVRYNGGNQLPGVQQLSSVIDYRDPMNISTGNPDLKSAFRHNISTEFMLKSLMRVSLSYGLTNNSITSLTLMDKTTGARRTSPTNINGNWNTSEYVFFTLPIHDVTLNMNANHTFNHNVSFVQSTTDNAAKKSMTNHHNLSTRLEGSYGNKYWTFHSGLGYSMNHSKSEYMAKSTKGQSINALAHISYEAPFGLELEVECNYDKPFGYEMASANKTQCMLNLGAEYRFLKRKLASLRLSWRDILNSYNGFNASMQETMWNESRTYGDTSMFVISFSYRINSFD